MIKNKSLLVLLLFHLSGAMSLRVLFARHAQSQNNVHAAACAAKFAGQPSSVVRSEFEKLRTHEPNLSDVGTTQVLC
jgi:hypothetical protein